MYGMRGGSVCSVDGDGVCDVRG
eukprot:COSAG01_NODE_79298_length_133_cov_29.823529_1_plen_22_part_01